MSQDQLDNIVRAAFALRSECNKLTDVDREQALVYSMAVIYGRPIFYDEHAKKTFPRTQLAILRSYDKENKHTDELCRISADHDFSAGPHQDTVGFAVGSNQVILPIEAPPRSKLRPDISVVHVDDKSLRPRILTVYSIIGGRAVCFPKGGGFQHNVPVEQLRPATEEEVRPKARIGYFGGDWLQDSYGNDIYFRGLTFGEVWNGWAVPYFTTANGLDALQHLDPEGSQVRYDKGCDTFYHISEDGERYDCEVAYHEGIRFHRIGEGWCWDEFNPKYESERQALQKQFAHIPGMADEIIEYYERLREV